MSETTKAVLKRFVKGALAGAATALGMISYAVPTAWEQFPSFISMLAIAAVGGAIVGLILAFQKWASWKE